MRVPFLDLRAAYHELKPELDAASRRVMESGWYILGEEIEAFEREFARYCGAKHCVAVGNGLDALILILRGHGIGSGDEVVVPANTYIASWLAVSYVGATLLPVEPNPETGNIDPDKIEGALTPRTKAIMAVHLYGQPAEMHRIAALGRRHGLRVLEDAAQAHGASFQDRHSGNLGDGAGFSFYPTKNLGAKGDAGALVTNSEEIAARLKELRNYGTRSRYEHVEVGFNSRLDEVQAAILSVRLDRLQRFNMRRQEIARKYFKEIGNSRVGLLSKPITPDHHVYHLFVIHCPERDRLADFLRKEGIETLVHYPIPAHHQKCCQQLRQDPHGLSNAESHARQCLSIPCHPQLGDDDVARVIAAINQFS